MLCDRVWVCVHSGGVVEVVECGFFSLCVCGPSACAVGAVLSVRPVMRVLVSVGALVVRQSRHAVVVCWWHVCIRLLF